MYGYIGPPFHRQLVHWNDLRGRVHPNLVDDGAVAEAAVAARVGGGVAG